MPTSTNYDYHENLHLIACYPLQDTDGIKQLTPTHLFFPAISIPSAVIAPELVTEIDHHKTQNDSAEISP